MYHLVNSTPTIKQTFLYDRAQKALFLLRCLHLMTAVFSDALSFETDEYQPENELPLFFLHIFSPGVIISLFIESSNGLYRI